MGGRGQRRHLDRRQELAIARAVHAFTVIPPSMAHASWVSLLVDAFQGPSDGLVRQYGPTRLRRYAWICASFNRDLRVIGLTGL